MTRVLLKSMALAAASVAALSLAACGGGEDTRARLTEARVTTIGVNTFLWRASLETVGFMPVTSSDANTGVITTDWFVNPQTPTERVRVSVFVLDKDLRADAVKVNAWRQQAQGGAWVDAPVRAGTVQKLEEAILTRARQIRQTAVQ
jgi:hypothetical protein